MPVVDIYNLKKEVVGQAELPDKIYGVEIKPHLVHEVVVAQLASRRAGTACTKTRGEIHGTTKKPYRQKGTGRARSGSFKSPLRRGGGTIFGPKPRDFSYRPPKKVRRGALKVALSAKLQDKELMVLDAMELEAMKTRHFASAMEGLGMDNALVITGDIDEILEKSSRNLQSFKVLRADGLNCYDLLKYKNLILLQASLPKIEERLIK